MLSRSPGRVNRRDEPFQLGSDCRIARQVARGLGGQLGRFLVVPAHVLDPRQPQQRVAVGCIERNCALQRLSRAFDRAGRREVGAGCGQPKTRELDAAISDRTGRERFLSPRDFAAQRRAASRERLPVGGQPDRRSGRRRSRWLDAAGRTRDVCDGWRRRHRWPCRDWWPRRRPGRAARSKERRCGEQQPTASAQPANASRRRVRRTPREALRRRGTPRGSAWGTGAARSFHSSCRRRRA